ncbi:MAG: hypothetical protein NTU41_14560 [Chloroflexi bacterium]|nr:hypothetical protein [Chloroflexota bacterium]
MDWNLAGYEIEEFPDGFSWGCYFDAKPVVGDVILVRRFVGVVFGSARIEHDTLIMGLPKCQEKVRYLHNSDEVREHLESLPPWDKTRYFIGPGCPRVSGLRNCRTGEKAPAEVADIIMPLLGFCSQAVEEG